MQVMPDLRRFTTNDGLRLAADVLGEPSRGSVILAHGGGQTRHAWSGAGQALAARGWRTVALDLRGHGDSEWSPVGDYRMHRFAEDLVDVAGQLGDRPALIGASLGGIAGLMVETVVAPGTFASLTMVDIVPDMEPSGVDKIMAFMSAHLSEGFGSLEEAADAVAAYMPHRPRPAELSGLRKNLREADDGRLRWHWDPRFVTGVRSGRVPDDAERLSNALGALTLPVHLIRGRMSELVSRQAALDFVARVPGAVFTDVAGAGHMVAGDRNDAFVEAATGFLDGLAREAA